LKKGIPVASFLNADGTVIGSTTNGELEPSRKYQSAQVLRFLHELVDNHRITTPH
jgi:glutaminase